MTGHILRIAGPTVTVDIEGLKLYDMVRVGEAGLTGEVVRLEQGRAVVQVYEDTRGLAAHEPAGGMDAPLTVQLGPGLLSGMFDGLQRPLERLRELTGPFVTSGRDLFPLDRDRKWRFVPAKRAGDAVSAGDVLGHVEEGEFRHLIIASHAGQIARLCDGDFSLAATLGEMADGREISAIVSWPVRKARPYRRKLSPTLPLVTGQRTIDFLFPLARGGTAIFPGGFGTGKTILEQSIAKFADVDIVVYVGCGERGNEMAELQIGRAHV